MLPMTYQLPAGLVLVAAGLVACFAGYRFLRAVLTIYGFIVGALFASTLVAPSNVPVMLVALVLGGIAGALILFAGYFAGVMLVGAGSAALVLRSLSVQALGREPHGLVVVLFAVLGAIAAVYAQRVVVIVATAFGGAQTAVAGLVAVLAARGPAPRGVDVWVGHLAPGSVPGPRWPLLAWLALGALGVFVQLASSPRRPAPRR